MNSEIVGPANVPGAREAEPAEILVWDVLVRIGHWLLVLFFLVAYFTEDDLLALHSWAGYGVGAYLVVRIIWGFVGPAHARFADFAYGPGKAARYLNDLIRFQARRYIGHSPAGGLMVFALLFCLAVTTVTGIALLAVEENAGPLAPWLGPSADRARAGSEPGDRATHSLGRVTGTEEGRDEDKDQDRDADDRDGGGESLEEVHEIFSNVTMLLVVLHVAGVVLASVVHKENLARAMLTGRKRAH